MNTIDLSKFNFNIVQEGLVYCIPASALAIFSYHDSTFSLSQHNIMQLMNCNPGFKAMKGIIDKNDQIKNTFSIEVLDTNFFDQWLCNIKKEIDDSYPIAISTKQSNGNVHVRVVIGYDDEKKYFLLFNPGTSYHFKDVNVVIRVSHVEVYNYTNAQNDWNGVIQSNNQEMFCRDQLIIHPKT